MYNMTKNTVMLIAIVLIGLAISGCTEHSTVNNATDIRANATNATVNTSEQAGNSTTPANDEFSLVFDLEKPPEDVIGGE
jgi:outer membrane murein-binding lipoprotein Lpp